MILVYQALLIKEFYLLNMTLLILKEIYLNKKIFKILITDDKHLQLVIIILDWCKFDVTLLRKLCL